MIRKLLLFMRLLVRLNALMAQGAKSDRLTLELILEREYVAAPQIAPDSSNIIYTRRWTDKINDRFESEIWIMNAGGSRNRFLTKGGNAVWSPDGKQIAFNN
jgi:dipeptidyl aminopeptidase/acylaminoacyl peptidase